MSLKDRVAKAWAEDLEDRLPGQRVYPMRRDAEAVLPFSVVVVKSLQQTTPGSNVWVAQIRIVHVSDSADVASLEHSKRVEKLRRAIEGTPKPGNDRENDVLLYGFAIEELQEASGSDGERKVFSDVFLIRAGVGAAG